MKLSKKETREEYITRLHDERIELEKDYDKGKKEGLSYFALNGIRSRIYDITNEIEFMKTNHPTR